MKDPFGVERNDLVAKGLPSALRGKKISQHFVSVKRTAMDHRIAASQRGKESAKDIGISRRMPNETSAGGYNPRKEYSYRGRNNIFNGKDAKSKYKKLLEDPRPWAAKSKRKLP